MLQLVEFNNLWKKHFQNEKELLQKAINGQECNDIEHIGATSVVMCKTCGTIDVLLSIPSKIEFFTLKNILVRSGYEFIENLSNQDCFFFVRRNNKKQIVATIRLVEYASDTYTNIILFKKYLKESKKTDKYNTFRETAIKHARGDVKKYQELKSNYITSIINGHFIIEK